MTAPSVQRAVDVGHRLGHDRVEVDVDQLGVAAQPGEVEELVDHRLHPGGAAAGAAEQLTEGAVEAPPRSSTSSSISPSDSSRAVRGFLRSWLTWPANAASRSLERLQPARAACSSPTVLSQLPAAQLELEHVHDPAGQGRDHPGLVDVEVPRLLVEDAQRADRDAVGAGQRVRGVEPHVAEVAGHERVGAEARVLAGVVRHDRAPPSITAVHIASSYEHTAAVEAVRRRPGAARRR